VNSGAITGLRYSNDGSRLALSSKDCTVLVYSVPKYEELARMSVVGPAMGCDWSPDDSRLCVALSGGVAGLAMIDTKEYSILSQEKVFTVSSLATQRDLTLTILIRNLYH
jgi:WD40 repeat protein